MQRARLSEDDPDGPWASPAPSPGQGHVAQRRRRPHDLATEHLMPQAAVDAGNQARSPLMPDSLRFNGPRSAQSPRDNDRRDRGRVVAGADTATWPDATRAPAQERADTGVPNRWFAVAL